jgi:hypothetical protein
MAATACARAGEDGSVAHQNGPLRVRDAWVRASNVTRSGALYLTLDNQDTVAVRVVNVDTPLAREASLHETMNMQGMTHMAARAELSIPRGATVTLTPGGMHVMLVDIMRPLAAGDTVPLTLRLRDGRTTPVSAIVRVP